MKDLEKTKEHIKFYFVRDHIPGAFPPAFEIFIYNNLKDVKMIDLQMETFSSIEDATSNITSKKFGDLIPDQIISIDKSDVYELDLLIMYNLIFQLDKKSYRIKLGIKGSPDEELVIVPQSNLNGVSLTDFKVSEIE
jgi:hypothetical protein